MDKRCITLITDYRGAFYSRHVNRKTRRSMNVDELHREFRKHDMSLSVMSFKDIDVAGAWEGRLVLYQSAEDPGLEYRSYIEDVMLALSLAKATLIPEFPFLRAHHNKVFFEHLRRLSKRASLNTLAARTYGAYEECDLDALSYPIVLKPAGDAASRGVQLAADADSAAKKLRSLMRSHDVREGVRERLKRLWRAHYVPYSLHRRKVVCQEFVPKLTCDYKVLVFGSQFYVLRRAVRPNDFRASGSGRFTWPTEVSHELLSFASDIVQGFDVPYASLDIAVRDSEHHLIEAQFVCFGTLTLEESPHHWERGTDGFTRVVGQAHLESVFATAVHDYCAVHQLI